MFIPPLETHLPTVGHRLTGNGQLASRHRLRLAPQRHLPKFATHGPPHRHFTPLHHRQRATPQVFHHGLCALQIGGQGDLGRDVGQLGTGERNHGHRLPIVAHFQPEGAGLEQAREFKAVPRTRCRAGLAGIGDLIGRGAVEGIVPRDRPGGDRGLTGDSRFPLGGNPPRPGPEGRLHRERFPLRDHHLGWQRLDRREGVAGDRAPGSQQPGPGGPGGGRQRERERPHQHCSRHGQSAEERQPRGGERGGHVPTGRLTGHLFDRRLAQRPRAGLLEVVAGQLDDPQQLVTPGGKPPGDEAGQLLGSAVLPDPAVQRPGDEPGDRQPRPPQQPPQPVARVDQPVGDKQQQPGGQQASDRGTGRLNQLDLPQAPPEEVQLPQQPLGETQRRDTSRVGHGTVTLRNRHTRPLDSTTPPPPPQRGFPGKTPLFPGLDRPARLRTGRPISSRSRTTSAGPPSPP